MTKLDIAVRWEGRQWIAYNTGVAPPYAASQNWSTALGDIDVEDIQTLFRNMNLTFLPTDTRCT
jgi:hypothetical protein